jgi:hypothetical protein
VPPCLNFLTKKAPYKGLGADSEEKREPVSDIDTAVVDSLKVLDPEWPIREADIVPLSTFSCAHLLMCGFSCKTAFSNEVWISM